MKKALSVPQLVILSVFVTYFACVLNVQKEVEPIEISLAEKDSLLDVFGSINIVLSKQIALPESAVQWSPLYFSFRIEMNTTQDTAELILLEDLAYNTTYSIYTGAGIPDTAELYIKDTVTFTTLPGEQEPNNTALTADDCMINTLYAGHITTWADKDYFLVPVSSTDDTLLLILSNLSDDLDLTLYSKDGTRDLLVSANTGTMSDSIIFFPEDTGSYPVNISVKPSKDANSRYHFQALRLN